MSKTIKLKHPTITSVSFDGVTHEAGKGGVFTVPEDVGQRMVAELGFVGVAAAGKNEPPPADPPAEQAEQSEQPEQ